MKSAFNGVICRLLAVALMLLPFQSHAGMIGTDRVSSAEAVQVDRAAILGLLSRAQTVNEFQALGLDPQAAQDRVAAMTDAEVGALAGKLGTLPAGGDGGSLLLLVLVGVLIWYLALRR